MKKPHWAILITILILFSISIGILAARSKGNPGSPLSPAPKTPIETAKIIVTEEGIYRLTAADLKALGWKDVDPTRLHLEHRGEPYPIWVRGEGKDLELFFYGQPAKSRYTLENAYFLRISKPNQSPNYPITQLPNYPTTQLPPAPTYTASRRLEKNLLYSPKTTPETTWYWLSLPAPRTETIEITLTGPASGEGIFRASLFASTQSSAVDPDHHLRILINDTLIADESWDGQGTRQIETPIPSGVLHEGTNTITLEAPGDTGVPADINLLDWIEIDYPRQAIAEDDLLTFTGNGNVLAIQGFDAPPTVFDIPPAGSGLNPAGEGHAFELESSTQETLLLPTEPGHRYIVAGPRGYLRLARIVAAQLTPDLRSPENQAGYIAIGPPDLLEPLQPLLELRQKQGLAVMAVPVNAVYDQFGDGLPTPMAIRSFLQYAAESWTLAPQYLFLVGDSTHDPRGFQAPPEANQLPSFFIYTFYGGETVSDIEFVKLDGDLLPDMAVGRIPARTPEQVKIVVEKTLAYEQNPPEGNWQRRALAIADGQDASFRVDAETFLGYFSDDFEPVLFAPKAKDSDAHTQIETYLNEGVLFMSYFGHGSITMLGKDRIFSTDDGAALTNQNLPVMINITCLAGLFTHPEVDSLSETMLWNPKGGAVATLSATSLTTPADQSFLSRALVGALLENPDAPLGQILLLAQHQLPVADNNGVREVMDTFLLFGDPALRLADK